MASLDEMKMASAEPPPPDVEQTAEEMPTEKSEEAVFKTNALIWKNSLILCFAFMFLFTAFQSLSNLQSSLFIGDGMGTTSLAVVYGALVLSCFFIPSPMIDTLGCKWTVAVAMACYIAYMAVHFHAIWELFIPAAFLVGIGAAPLWSAKCTYLTDVAHDYAKKNNMTNDGAVNLFFGVFFMIFQSSQIWGNLISSQVLSPRGGNSSAITELPPEILAQCGHNFCPGVSTGVNNTNLEMPPQSQVFMLAGIYTGCAVIAVLVISIFLEQLPSESSKRLIRCSQTKCTGKLFIATFLHMKDYRQLLLIPLTMFSGLEQGFLTGDFTQAFITCPLGSWWIGYVLMCYGAVDAICSFTFGRLVQYVGRAPFFFLGAAINFSLLIIFLHFETTQDKLYVYFIFAGFWGMADGIWQTQLNALYGVLFYENTEAGFSNYRLWESLGFIAAFVYQSRSCMPYKIYALLAVLSLGILGYSIVEFLQWKKKRNSTNISK